MGTNVFTDSLNRIQSIGEDARVSGEVILSLMHPRATLTAALPVRMDERLVRVQVLMTLRDVQPHAGSHQGRSGPEEGVGRFAEQPQRDRSAEERRNREIGASARGSQVA